MSGLYIHIPFCKSKCPYCDFYSIHAAQLHAPFINTLEKEMALLFRKDIPELSETLTSIYIGGGTPSLLSVASIDHLLKTLLKYFKLSDKIEISLEANPDDLNEWYLSRLRSAGINRISIGVQALNDRLLRFLKRRHDSYTALSVIESAQKAGFSNISADLIYGFPHLSIKEWEHSLKQIINTGISHLSAYHLEIEKDVPLYHELHDGKWQLIAEDESYAQFKSLFDVTAAEAMPWYELSNFAYPGMHSRHNSSYWEGKPYFGFGPSAHSYFQGMRHWNPPDIVHYMSEIEKGRLPLASECLSDTEILNEYLMTRLRTRRGIEYPEFAKRFGDATWNDLQQKCSSWIQTDKMIVSEEKISLNVEGLFVSDMILKDILYI